MNIPIIKRKDLVQAHISLFLNNDPVVIRKIITTFLKKHYERDSITVTESFVMVEGDIPICLVAHMDTVFHEDLKLENIFYEIASNSYHTIGTKRGMGADDRAGIIAIMEIIKSGRRPHIIFTDGEEIGLIGARAFTDRYPDLPFDCKYFIELDRKGCGEAVFYNNEDSEFIGYIESFGFAEDIGSSSDIAELGIMYEIAAVNLSIGYWNEHFVEEELYLDAMEYTIKVVKRMLDAEKTAKYFSIDLDADKFSNLYGYGNYKYLGEDFADGIFPSEELLEDDSVADANTAENYEDEMYLKWCEEGLLKPLPNKIPFDYWFGMCQNRVKMKDKKTE